MSHLDCHCFALRQATRYVTQIYERHLAPVGVTSTQYSLLAKLARLHSQTMAELAESMVMDRTSLVRALKPLQRDGLVVSEASEHDARAHAFRLTPQGKETFRKAVIAWRAAQEEFEAQYGQEQARALRAALFSLTETQ
jgi:DNA-binding MarR family transcriptional regulator